jgi:uncharacterized protein YqgV (UPF0045/DUF77 family)
MNVTAGFLIEPFNEGAPGAHVEAALAALEGAGYAVEIGPFGSSLTGAPHEVMEALTGAFTAAMTSGANRVTLTLEAEQT